MRILLPSLAVALVVAAPVQAATRNFGITSFTKIRVEGPYRVTLATGVAPFAKAASIACPTILMDLSSTESVLITLYPTMTGSLLGSYLCSG